jgi:serine/threonine-protein kinase
MLEQFFAGLPQEYQQAVSDSLALWKKAGVVPQNFDKRELEGSLSAPVKVVEFTDIKCPHCKHFLESMNEAKAHLPPGSISIESRYFPLDAECNSDIPPNFSDHTGVRCLGAKVQICLETQPDFLKLREALFAAQNTLNTDSIMDIGSSGSMSRKDLEACVQSPATAKKLADDVQYATLYHAEGTPLVLVNGRDASPIVEFIYALALAGGDTSLPAFSKLPPPSQQAVQ